MAYNYTVYSVKYSRRSEEWGIYVDGQPMVKSKTPSPGGSRRRYMTYDKKSEAVKEARRLAKKDSNRKFGTERTQLKVWNKAGSDTTEVSNYD